MERNAPYPPLAEVAPRFGGDGGGFPTPCVRVTTDHKININSFVS
jgi:hypothetical protein